MARVDLQSQLPNIDSYERSHRRGPAVAVFHDFPALLLVFKTARGFEFGFSYAESVVRVVLVRFVLSLTQRL